MLLLSTCMVQEGQFSAEQRVALEAALKAVAKQHVGSDATLAVAWRPVPKGSGYSAGKPSTSSLVQLSVPDGFGQASREAIMHDVNERWCAITGQTPYQLMVSVPDQSAARELLKGMLAEVPLSQKPGLILDHVKQLARSVAAGR